MKEVSEETLLQSDQVTVTSTRFIISDKTYFLSEIASVEYTNRKCEDDDAYTSWVFYLLVGIIVPIAIAANDYVTLGIIIAVISLPISVYYYPTQIHMDVWNSYKELCWRETSY